MIDWDKPVQTRDGREVAVYTTKGRVGKKVVGEVLALTGLCWELHMWSRDGTFDKSSASISDLDLANVPQKHTVWVSIHSTGFHIGVYGGFSSSDDARAASSKSDLIACVPITYTEGEGLDK